MDSPYPVATPLGGEADPSFLRSVFPLLILALAMASGFTMMTSFSLVQEGAKAEMHLSDTILGVVQGVSAAVPLVLFSIPIGILVDRTHRIRLLIGLSAIWTLGTFLTAIAHNVPMLFIARNESTRINIFCSASLK